MSKRETREKGVWVSERSFLQPRKEGRVSASVWLSDLQECRICGRASLLFFLAGCLWPAVSFFLFLCRFTCLPSPTHFVWILLGYSHCRGTQRLIGLSDTVQLSFIPVQYFPINFSETFQRWGGSGSQSLWFIFSPFTPSSVSSRQVCPLHPLSVPLLRRSFGFVSSPHRRAVTVFLLGRGAPWVGAAVRWRAAAGGGGSVGQGQGRVRRRGEEVPIPFWGAQRGRRRKGERQRESSHVEKPANPARHLRRREETVRVSAQPVE